MSLTIVSLFVLFLPYVQCFCTSKNYSATAFPQYLTHSSWGNKEDCSFTIVPAFNYGQGYFLEISWFLFSVDGDMPDCEKSYVEVFLTRSEKSIGKFCSNNLAGVSSLFNMYSNDGYAKIKFHTSNTEYNQFSIRYSLRADALSGIDACSSNYMYTGADNFYTSNWPKGYESGGTCTFSINSLGTKKLVFMDLDLRNFPFTGCNTYESDYIEIKGADSDVGYSSANFLKGPICDTSNSITYTAKQINIVYVKLFKQSFSSKRRGLLAGYISYNEVPPSQLNTIIICTMTVGILLIILTAICIGCCICKHNRKRNQERQSLNVSPENAVDIHYGTVYPSQCQYVLPAAHTGPVLLPSYSEAISAPYQNVPSHGEGQLPSG